MCPVDSVRDQVGRIPVSDILGQIRAWKNTFGFFLVIFFIEMISRQRIHPVQYLLTGFALIVFYSLLLALSEHLNFALAYLISSASIVSIIVVYANSIFSQRRFAIITLLVLTALYTFLYTILQMSDFALLLGNIGLVVILALVMFFSRKIEWYNESNS